MSTNLTVTPTTPQPITTPLRAPWVNTERARNPLTGLAEIMKDNQSDVKKTGLNFFRQFFIPSDRGIGYMWRSLSQPLNIYMKFATGHLMRNVVTGPLMESALELNKIINTNNNPAVKLDGNGAFEIRDSDLANLHMRLLDRSYAGKKSFQALPRMLQADGRMETKTLANGKVITYNAPIPINDPFIQHLYLMLDFNHYLTNVVDGYKNQGLRLPIPGDFSLEETKAAVEQTKLAMKHLDGTKLTSFMYEGRRLLRDVANGMYCSSDGNTWPGRFREDEKPTDKTIDHSYLKTDFERFNHKKQYRAPADEVFVKHLLNSFIETTKSVEELQESSELKKAADKAVKELAKHFLDDYESDFKSTEQLLPEQVIKRNSRKLLRLLTALQGGEVNVRKGLLFSKGETIPFVFDSKNKLGLKDQDLPALAHKMATSLHGLDQLFIDNTKAVIEKTTPDDLRVKGKELLAKFDHALLTFASHFPGQKAEANTLKATLDKGPESPLFKLLQLGLRADTCSKTLRSVVDSAKLPDIILGILPSLYVAGVVWANWDNKYIQPYQKGVTLQKGDVKGATAGFVAGNVVGWGAYFGAKSLKLFSSGLKLNETHSFLANGATALGLAGLATYGTMRAMFALRPTMGADGKLQPIPAGHKLEHFKTELTTHFWDPLKSVGQKPSQPKPPSPPKSGGGVLHATVTSALGGNRPVVSPQSIYTNETVKADEPSLATGALPRVTLQPANTANPFQVMDKRASFSMAAQHPMVLPTSGRLPALVTSVNA